MDRDGKNNVPFSINEVFTPSKPWIVEDLSKVESESQIDGNYIIGRVRGQFFCPGGTSRNGRFYPETLWEKVLKNKDVVCKMNERKMYGTIGHDEEPVSEQQLREGGVSHIVTKMWIDVDEKGKKLGMGEALILGTDAGKNLNIYLRAGSKLNTSSRASGRFLESNTPENVPIVDEDSFLFETFDFVLDPGFLEASPQLVEKYGFNKEQNMGNDTMENVFNESMKTILENRDSLRAQLDLAIREKDDLAKRLDEAQSKWESVKHLESISPLMEKLSINEETWGRVSRVVEDLGLSSFKEVVVLLEKIDRDDVPAIRSGRLNEKMSELLEFKRRLAPTVGEGIRMSKRISEDLDSYRKFGKPEDISERIGELEEIKNSLSELGTIEEITEALVTAKKEIDAFSDMGTRNEIEEALRSSLVLLKEYRKYGTPSKINEALTASNRLADFVLKAGGRKSIVENIKRLRSLREKNHEEKISTISEKMSSAYRVPVNEVRKMVESMGVKKSNEVLKKIAGNRQPCSFNMSETLPRSLSGKSDLVESMFVQATAKR